MKLVPRLLARSPTTEEISSDLYIITGIPAMASEGEKVEHFCSREGCENKSKLQCPTCLKQGIEGSYFCSQVRAVSLTITMIF
jgi:methionyl aminopeptidase